LITPTNFRLKVLVYSPSGFGKSTWAATAPNPGICAAETGHGNGLLSVTDKDIEYFEPSDYSDVELFAGGHVFKGKETLVLDGMSYLTQTIIKSAALAIPRGGSQSKKREAGTPEIDDWGQMAEYERRILARLLSQDAHVIVTALQEYYEPPADGKPERLGTPSLPGQMRLGSAAMFDVVLRLCTRHKLRDPKDPKSVYIERYFQTEADGKYLAKSRLRNGMKPLFPPEVIFDPTTGQGDFKWFLAEVQKAFAAQQVSGPTKP
jgi:hypothetical protein